VVQKFRGVEHGAGPRLDDGEFDGIDLGVIIDLGAPAGDFGIQGGDAQAQVLGFGATNAIVFGG